MIRRLRAKLVAIIMAFAAVILVCVMTAVLGLTRVTLERESLDMMRHIALDPIQTPAPGEEFDGVRPFSWYCSTKYPSIRIGCTCGKISCKCSNIWKPPLSISAQNRTIVSI